jgi:hypothetical protein
MNVRDLRRQGLAKYQSGNATAVWFFKEEADADAFAASVKAAGATYNGGYFHGKPCGREKERDHTDQHGVRWFAVTH